MKKNNFITYSLNDSMNSEKDLEEFLNGDETQIFFGKESKILSEERLSNYILSIDNIKTFQDLTINSLYYYPLDKNQEFYLFKEYSNYAFTISKLIKKYPVIQLYGPKGRSKTTFLLYLRFFLNRLENGVFYINYDYLDNNPNKKREILYNELLYSAVFKGNTAG